MPTKVCLIRAMVFPGVTYGCESWTIKKAEHWRIDAFELWCWRRLLKVPWSVRSNQPILKEINPEYSLKVLMLKLQYFGHLLWRAGFIQGSVSQSVLLRPVASTSPDNLLKCKWAGSTLDKGSSSQIYDFSSSHVWMWEFDYKETWAPKNWCFEKWCWRRLLRVPWTARRSNQSIQKEISPECSLEGLMLKLKLQYFGHLMWRTDSKDPDVGKD